MERNRRGETLRSRPFEKQPRPGRSFSSRESELLSRDRLYVTVRDVQYVQEKNLSRNLSCCVIFFSVQQVWRKAESIAEGLYDER